MIFQLTSLIKNLIKKQKNSSAYFISNQPGAMDSPNAKTAS